MLPTLAQQIDRVVLYTLNRRMPNAFERGFEETPSLEAVLAQTRVNERKTAVYALSAPGEHGVWLDTAVGELRCHIRVRPAVDPNAPLVLYHPGFNEFPYDNSWRRIFRTGTAFPAHAVCIQAPFHDSWSGPVNNGFKSIRGIYQIFAGSLRLMELVQRHFEEQGAAFKMLTGLSWGGITAVLYQSLFQQAQAVAPMLSSPDLSRVLWDTAQMFGRPVPVSRQTLSDYLDFTPYYERCQTERIFPLLAENDMFFQFASHEGVFGERPLVKLPAGHISTMWQPTPLRRHILNVLSWAEQNSL